MWMNEYKNQEPVIGTAWYGKHVVVIRCNPYTNQFLGLHKSLHAPTEPPNPNCAETLAQYFSIGYRLLGFNKISENELYYILSM
jgi:hypothetical protein